MVSFLTHPFNESIVNIKLVDGEGVVAKKFEILKESDRPKIVKRLMRLRKKLGWSQARLAEEWNVYPGTIGLWETGDRAIPGPVQKLIEIYEAKV